jgi:hypothetical protein
MGVMTSGGLGSRDSPKSWIATLKEWAYFPITISKYISSVPFASATPVM